MNTWKEAIGPEKEKEYFISMMKFVQQERAKGIAVYPAKEDTFNAYKYTELNDVNVVILGQDPYHGPMQAHGLAFSVQHGVPVPPSLRNMYKELASDIPGFIIPRHGNLEHWAKEGVLLLNTVLTVERGKAHSHAEIGWERFTDVTIEQINRYCDHVVFLLWGSHAQKKGRVIDTSRHLVLSTTHPSPLSAHRGFLGCKHFSKANAYLQQIGKKAINWNLPLD